MARIMVGVIWSILLAAYLGIIFTWCSRSPWAPPAEEDRRRRLLIEDSERSDDDDEFPPWGTP